MGNSTENLNLGKSPPPPRGMGVNLVIFTGCVRAGAWVMFAVCVGVGWVMFAVCLWEL